MLCRRSPNLPHTYACSTIGPARLNFRVRDGNGWDPRGMVTGKLERRLAGVVPPRPGLVRTVSSGTECGRLASQLSESARPDQRSGSRTETQSIGSTK